MRIVTFRRRRWREAVETAGHTCIDLPPVPTEVCLDSTLEARIAHGRRVYDMLKGKPIDLIVDAHGDGMLFLDDPREKGMSVLLHHALEVPLVSHWTESMRIMFKRMDLAVVLEALQSPTWFKGIFTRAHLEEMAWMGIPGCFYLPLAANNIPYPLDRPSVDTSGPTVLFSGRQLSRYFAHADGVDVRTQWPGAIALAAQSDGSVSSFLEAYRRYDFGPAPESQETYTERAEAIRRYYACKMFYVASRNLATRDRFVYALQKRLGKAFLLIGDERWHGTYGLKAVPPVDQPTYYDLLRRAPICINMVNGDNDSGLNLRHYEIPALGGFMLSYHQPELPELFQLGSECDSFRNETELLERIHYYVEHMEERNRIARAGQEKTVRKHLLHHRLESILTHLHRQGHL